MSINTDQIDFYNPRDREIVSHVIHQLSADDDVLLKVLGPRMCQKLEADINDDLAKIDRLRRLIAVNSEFDRR